MARQPHRPAASTFPTAATIGVLTLPVRRGADRYPSEAQLALSYTQNLEDYHLWIGLGENPTGFYIDVGAGHPIADNFSMWLYERGWRGIVVEPQPALAALYPLVRPRDICVSQLLGREEGEIDFHVFARLHGLSTTVARHADGARAFGDDFRVVRTRVTTLAALCARHGVDQIDVLKIDVEGAEADVLAGNDWSRYRPRVVVAEAIEPGTGAPAHTAWEPSLIANGYTFVLDDTLNRFYVANEAEDVLERFPRQRAAWDSATHMYEIGRASENPAHPDHALARDLSRGLWASLPHLEPELLARLIVAGRVGQERPDATALARALRSDAMRAALGRIACGYDGGQIIEGE